MTPAEFRRLALSLPETTEAAHLGHPDFRVGGKIFATLHAPRPGCGMVKLSREEQQAFMAVQPGAFTPATGAWGEAGATIVALKTARKGVVRSALAAAWRGRAPQRRK